MSLLKWVATAALMLVAACSTTGSSGSSGARDFQFGQDFTACLNRPAGCTEYRQVR